LRGDSLPHFSRMQILNDWLKFKQDNLTFSSSMNGSNQHEPHFGTENLKHTITDQNFASIDPGTLATEINLKELMQLHEKISRLTPAEFQQLSQIIDVLNLTKKTSH